MPTDRDPFETIKTFLVDCGTLHLSDAFNAGLGDALEALVQLKKQADVQGPRAEQIQMQIDRQSPPGRHR